MISKKELKVLKFLKEQNSLEPVDIQPICFSQQEAFCIIDSLTKKGLLEDFSSFDSASAKITNDGIALLENHKKERFHKALDWLKYGITTAIAIAALIISIAK